MVLFTDLVQRIAILFGLIPSDEKLAGDGLRECCKAIKDIRNALRSAKTFGEKQHLEACLRNLRSYRNQYKSIQKRGGGLRPEGAKNRTKWNDSDSAFSSRIQTGVITNLNHKDPHAFLVDCKALFKRRILNALKKDESLKVNTVFCGEFIISKGDQVLIDRKYFTTHNAPIYKITNLDGWFDDNVIHPIQSKLEEFQERDSGWSLKNIVNLGVNVNKFTAQLGSSYIDLPTQIKRKHACVNVKNNNDQACFAWAVTSALRQASRDSDRVSSYPHYSDVLKLKGIQFPMTFKQIPMFEKQNMISINVYILQQRFGKFSTLPSYLTMDKKLTHVNLLLIQNIYCDDGDVVNGGTSEIKYHYVWIKNLSRLLSKQLSNENGRKYVCDRCLHYFRTEEKLNKHTIDCVMINETAIKMPEEGRNILKFTNYKNGEKVPFIVYADLESVLRATGDAKKPQKHIPAAVGYYLKCSYDNSLSFYKSYRGEDCMQWFADEMKKLAEDLVTVFLCSYNINMSVKDEEKFQFATHCHICEHPFEPDSKKVRDHNHLIPEKNYRGAAHENCNINYKDSHVVPVVFHNLSGYDSHFIITDIASRMDGRVDLLPITKEKYISFTKHIEDERIQFRFIDSYRFLASSLEKLVSYLEDFPNLKSEFKEASGSIDLITRKGVMPYDYIDSFNKFNDTSLPTIDEFYNKLENEWCSPELYSRAQIVWNSFDCKTLGEYVDLYMKTDILLLADVFEQFRSSCLKTYNLDPAHYYTLPGYTWDAMLKYTKQELELLTDPDMFLFVERGIRGGLSQVCAKRRSHANNKYMSNYNPSRPDTYLMYYDVNNQYGWAMSQALPYGGFEWASNINIDVTSIPDDSPEGYILEVDLEYPQYLHDVHNDLPFCSSHINSKTGQPPKTSKEVTKLMATFKPKEKYIIHYRALKQALEQGLKLTKIHRILSFNQSLWLKPYIDLNTELRKTAKNEFEKNLFKLMVNAVFGKTMENIRKRVNIRLLTEWFGRYGAEALISKPEFKSCSIFNENLVAVEMKKLQVFLNKPLYAGQAILDLAKTTLYDFHYTYMKPQFGDDCSIVYTDTDSLIYEIRNQDPYMILKRDAECRFDTSDYPPNNQWGISQVNKKVLGKMKDENCGSIMTDFVGLRSKLYAVKTAEHCVVKKAKGVKSSVVKTDICFDDYIECLERCANKVVTQNLIQSVKHSVYSITQEKIALSSQDDKRYICADGVNTLALGHYSITEDSLKRKLDDPATTPLDSKRIKL